MVSKIIGCKCEDIDRFVYIYINVYINNNHLTVIERKALTIITRITAQKHTESFCRTWLLVQCSFAALFLETSITVQFINH